MRDRALEVVRRRPAAIDGVNILREYVQSRILGQMQEAGAFVPLAFMGGTALRFLFRIGRFSEDLDFTLERGQESFDFGALASVLNRELAREGYNVRVRVNENTAVKKAQIGFSGLLADAGLSPHADQVLWVKLEVDTDPPAGAGLAVSTIDAFGPLRVQHHDAASLMAGKIAAVLAREYTKGRDFYDLWWYLTREPALTPNLELLAAALRQTAPHFEASAVGDWRGALSDRLDSVDWDAARQDVEPFLEQPRDILIFEPQTFMDLLAERS